VASDIVLISDPRVLAVPIVESGEPMVDLHAHPEILLDPRLRPESNSFFNVRRSVADKLVAAAKTLPAGIRFLLIEGHRPLSLQKMHFEEYSKTLRELQPSWDAQRVYQEASKYIAPPEIIPPHSTGAAIDITLADAKGIEIDMGTALNATPVECDNACFTEALNISAEAKENRAILIAALSGVGFVNYPTEWWHWSYGDRYWAYVLKRKEAIFSSIG
jgi:D-alanyl-D-alanine dipeptidase